MDRGDSYGILYKLHRTPPEPTGTIPRQTPSGPSQPKRSRNRNTSTHTSQAQSITNSVNSGSTLDTPQHFGRRYLCRGCDLHFDYYANRDSIIGRVPCILPCGHTLCRECIIKSLKTNNKTQCLVCLEIKEGKQQTDYNHYILGHLATAKITGVNIPDVRLTSTKEKVGNAGFRKNSLFTCAFHDCRNIGTVSCLNCFKLFCDECDNKVHRSKNKQMHMRNNFQKVSFELGKCPDHTLRQDIYCTGCHQFCCCYCFLDKHEGHGKEYLTRLTENEEENLKEAYKVISGRIEELERNQATTEESKEENDIGDEISTYFADIHARLYLIEKNLLQEAKQRSAYGNIDEGDTIMSTSIDTLRHVIKCVDERGSAPYNMRALYTTLMELKSMPFPSKVPYDREVMFTIDPKIHKLEEYFKLVTSSPVVFPLSSDDDQENATSEVGVNPQELENTRKWVQELRLSNEPVKIDNASTNNDEMKLFSPRQIVYVTHFISANCFYVQSKELGQQFRQFEKSFERYLKRPATGVITVNMNERYLAPTTVSSVKWGRVQVLEKLPGEKREWSVFFLDYGHTASCKRRDLKRVFGSFISVTKPFALKCMLHKPSETEWSDTAHLKMKEILNVNKEVKMNIVSISDDHHVVDLFVTDSKGAMFSIADLIMIHQTAPSKDLSLNSSAAAMNIFENTDVFSVGQSYEVFLRYILDPFHVFIQKASYENVFRDMIISLEKQYEHSKCDIFLPVEGSDIVVFYPTEDFGNWHRARIQDIEIAAKHAIVFLVDWGKQVNVRWSDMRKLSGLFLGTECLVFCAGLADINPKSDDGWLCNDGIEAIHFLETYCSKSRTLRMLVSESRPLKIALFEKKSEFDENLNALLVENNLAVCRGKLSSTVKWPVKKVREDEDTGEFFPIQKGSDSEDTEEEIEGPKLRVKLIRFVDPHLILFSIVSRRKNLDRLYEELQIYYKHPGRDGRDIVGKKTWSCGEVVVVFNEIDRDYLRARIKQIVENKYYVFLIDIGENIFIEGIHLRPILPYFEKKFPFGVLKCHLANIKPAGDSDKWSTTSIEWFERMFSKHTDLFIQKIGTDETRISIPVSMWYSKVTQGSALEPTTYQFFSVEMKAVAAGLAFQITKTQRRIRKKSATGPPPIVIPSIPSPLPIYEEVPKRDNSIQLSPQWLEPPALKILRFDAIITCVECEGYLYVRDEGLQSDYLTMEKLMKKHFDSIAPANPFNVYENQMVTVRSEGVWYRGLILEVIDEETVRVMMVDFGSDHIVKTRHLHKRIMYADIPIFARKICLFDVIPVRNSIWTTYNTDVLMKTIPEFAKVVIRYNNLVPLADIYNRAGVCFNDTFVGMCVNLRRLYGPSEPLEPAAETLFDPNYVFLRPKTLPGQKVQCDFISFSSYDKVSLFYMSDMSKKDEFERLSQSMQTEAPNLELLAEVIVGAPCVSRFETDGKWYRAQVIDTTDDDTILVFYVDYGNFESVHLSDIRKMKPEWFGFPAYCTIARINYKLVSGCDKKLYDLFNEKTNTPVMVEVIRDEPFTVHLYEANGDFIYKDFINNGTVVPL